MNNDNGLVEPQYRGGHVIPCPGPYRTAVVCAACGMDLLVGGPLRPGKAATRGQLVGRQPDLAGPLTFHERNVCPCGPRLPRPTPGPWN
jgi:hypothetical protein